MITFCEVQMFLDLSEFVLATFKLDALVLLVSDQTWFASAVGQFLRAFLKRNSIIRINVSRHGLKRSFPKLTNTGQIVQPGCKMLQVGSQFLPHHDHTSFLGHFFVGFEAPPLFPVLAEA